MKELSYFMDYVPGYSLFKDGSYPIDNDLAERQVRPFTALRKVILHHGSVVNTVKLVGVSVCSL